MDSHGLKSTTQESQRRERTRGKGIDRRGEINDGREREVEAGKTDRGSEREMDGLTAGTGRSMIEAEPAQKIDV